MTNTCATLSLNDMAAVNGGTFTKNEYERWMYEKAGFTCDWHFLAKDEFILNGVTYHEPEANKIMESLGWKCVTKTSYLCGGGVHYDIKYYYNGKYVGSR